MRCDFCGRYFKPLSDKSRFCSFECARKFSLREKRRLQANERAEKATAKVTNLPPKKKSLEDWIREASKCNMDYGNYRAQIEQFGKTFEQLKAQADSKSGEHAHCRRHFIRY